MVIPDSCTSCPFVCDTYLTFQRLTARTGSLDIAAKAMEVDIAKGGLHMLVEKPISMRPAEEVERLSQVIERILCF